MRFEEFTVVGMMKLNYKKNCQFNVNAIVMLMFSMFYQNCPSFSILSDLQLRLSVYFIFIMNIEIT